jgi:hypothetical protein
VIAKNKDDIDSPPTETEEWLTLKGRKIEVYSKYCANNNKYSTASLKNNVPH